MLISSGSVDAMAATMAEGHCFIDSLGQRVCGREAVRAAWWRILG
jgi:ketosteroid isomerase-like protein